MPEIRAYYLSFRGNFIPISAACGTIEEEDTSAQEWAIKNKQESFLGYMKGDYFLCRVRYQPK